MRLPRKMEYQHRMLGTYHFINKGDAEMSLRRCRLLACAFPTQHSDKVVFVLPHHSLRPDATPARNARSPLRNMSLLHLFENGILCRFGARVNATMLPPKWLGWRGRSFRFIVSAHGWGQRLQSRPRSCSSILSNRHTNTSCREYQQSRLVLLQWTYVCAMLPRFGAALGCT